ncbi:hypothetical protein IRT44_00100 [Anoxybacillus sediminis]|nr:hypothetical protein IRT44_00100 [Anoxybacillus sediminis]
MYSVQPCVFEAVSECARRFQEEVAQLAERFALRVDGGFPALELQVHPHFQAILEYTLWGDAGVVVIRGKVGTQTESRPCKPIAVTMKFSLSHDPELDIEAKKQRIEEILAGETELSWIVPPAGHVGHLELTLRFESKPGSGLVGDYARTVLGIVTGKVMAA